MKTRTYLALALVAGLLGTSIIARAENLGTVTAGSISGTTISGNTISGGTITGTTISGGSVSGTTITGGTISGTTISGALITGSEAEFAGVVELDGDGITFDAGTGTANRVKWTDGSSLHSASGGLSVVADNTLFLAADGGSDIVSLNSSGQFSPQSNGSVSLGSSSQEWGASHISQVNLSHAQPLIMENATWKVGTRYVCVNASGVLFPSAVACN